jgi:hypothetical protein
MSKLLAIATVALTGFVALPSGDADARNVGGGGGLTVSRGGGFARASGLEHPRPGLRRVGWRPFVRDHRFPGQIIGPHYIGPRYLGPSRRPMSGRPQVRDHRTMVERRR